MWFAGRQRQAGVRMRRLCDIGINVRAGRNARRPCDTARHWLTAQAGVRMPLLYDIGINVRAGRNARRPCANGGQTLDQIECLSVQCPCRTQRAPARLSSTSCRRSARPRAAARTTRPLASHRAQQHGRLAHRQAVRRSTAVGEAARTTRPPASRKAQQCCARPSARPRACARTTHPLPSRSAGAARQSAWAVQHDV